MDELVKYVTDQLSKCKKDAYEQQAYLNISYFAGKQWISLDRSTGKLITPTLEPWQIRYTANKIQPIIRTEHAKLTKNKFVMYVNPATVEDSDIRSARISEKVVEWLEYSLSLQDKDRENCLWGLTTGISFMKPYWNPSKGREIDDGKGGTIHEGDVDICVCSIFELKFDTSCSRWEDVPWICHDKIRSTDYIKKVYGKDVKSESIVATNLYEAKLASTVSNGVEYKSRENSAVVHEYWELPTSDYPKGRRVTICGDQVLVNEEDIGFGSEERVLPFFPFFHIQVPGRLIPTCLAEQLIPPQREYNKSRSQIIENKNLVGNPILLIPNGALDEEPTNEPGQVLFYNPVGTIAYLQPPTMGVDVYKNLDYIDAEIEFISGQHETSHGTTPAGVTSGTAIGYLQEQDDTKLGPTIANWISCKQKYVRYLLNMVQNKYDIERTVRIAGDNRKVEVVTFKGADLTSIDVRINESTMYQTSKAANQDFILKLVQYNMFDPTDQKQKQKIMKVLEIGIMDEMYSDAEQDALQAQTENDKWRTGDLSPTVRDFYNHDVHVQEHNKLRKSETYSQMDDKSKAMIDAHVDMHMEEIMKQLVPQQTTAETSETPQIANQPSV